MISAQGKPFSAMSEQVTEPAGSSEPPARGVQELGCGLRGWGRGWVSYLRGDDVAALKVA